MDMALEESSIQFIHVIISLAILLFAAKLFAELFHRLKLPVVINTNRTFEDNILLLYKE
jgi:hypothetical protein